MKNAIIIIGTGRYSLLTLRLINNLFFYYKGSKGLDIHYFSDHDFSKVFRNKDAEKISVIFHSLKHSSWWQSAFYKINAIKHFDYSEYSYISCLDADSDVVHSFTDSDIFLPIFAMEHCSKDSMGQNAVNLFEEFPDSAAYIPKESRKRYFQTDYFGGTSEIFLKMVGDASAKASSDSLKKSNISYTYADEAYLQPFLNKNKALIFDRYSKDFPFEMGNKGFLTEHAGASLDFFKIWPDPVYKKMMQDAIKLTKNGEKWNIINDHVAKDQRH